jgi:hypothetical protein
MKLKDFLAVSGKGGIFKFVSQARNGIVAESLTDKKRTIIHSTSKVSSLEDMAIYTDEGEVPLADIFKKIFEFTEGKQAVSHKSHAGEIKKAFENILPDYDRDRVYVSDMKKVFQWYNQLLTLDMLNFDDDDEVKKDNSSETKVKTPTQTKQTTEKKAPPENKSKPQQPKQTNIKKTTTGTRKSSGN